MAKLTRQPQKIFAGAANADQIAVMGSMKTGTPDYSTDLDSLQSSAYPNGWSDAILNDKAPFLEEMNGVQYGFSYQISYLLQQGISVEWDTTTTYYKGSVVAVVDTSDGVKVGLYMSLTDNNTGHNPTIDAANWTPYFSENIGRIGEVHITTDFNNRPINCVWLEGQSLDKNNYPKLFDIYQYTYGGSGDNFNVPDFTDCVMWGGTTPGTIAAGLPNIIGSINSPYGYLAGGSSGAFSSSNSHSDWDASNSAVKRNRTLNFAASSSNSIYGNSETVQPPAIKVRCYTRYQ